MSSWFAAKDEPDGDGQRGQELAPICWLQTAASVWQPPYELSFLFSFVLIHPCLSLG